MGGRVGARLVGLFAWLVGLLVVLVVELFVVWLVVWLFVCGGDGDGDGGVGACEVYLTDSPGPPKVSNIPCISHPHTSLLCVLLAPLYA